MKINNILWWIKIQERSMEILEMKEIQFKLKKNFQETFLIPTKR